MYIQKLPLLDKANKIIFEGSRDSFRWNSHGIPRILGVCLFTRGIRTGQVDSALLGKVDFTDNRSG